MTSAKLDDFLDLFSFVFPPRAAPTGLPPHRILTDY